MAQEYPRAHEFYLQLQDLQPQLPHYHSQYDLSHHQANSSATPSYGELTASDGGGQADAQAPPAALLASHPPSASQPAVAMSSRPPHQHHDPRKKKGTQMLTATFDDLDLSTTASENQYEVEGSPQRKRKAYSHTSERFDMATHNINRKRKTSVYGNASTYDDDCDTDSRCSSMMTSDKKQNHSEIEKRRRDKMNTYISELSSMIPMCGAMSRKLDKLTVLRMAVQHLRSIRGTLSACPLTASPRPAYLKERELNSLLLQTAKDCFLLVVGCDRGRLLYVSASVKQMLHYESSELLGQSLFDILHPKDVAKVKEQLSSSDLSPRERLIDIKTMMPVKADMIAGASRFGPGARRSFFCRIKCKVAPESLDTNSVPIKEEVDTSGKMRKKQSNEKKYCVVQFTGYLKSWAASELSPEGNIGNTESGEDGETVMSCLVAVGRTLPDLTAPMYTAGSLAPPTRPLQYISRHATDGKFLFVDQRVTLALGFLPQELLGTSLYEYVSGPELSGVARTHKQALLRREALHTPPYNVRKKDNTLVRIQTHFKPFRNPWTKDIECLVANNTVINESQSGLYEEPAQSTYDIYRQLDSSNDRDDTGGGRSPPLLSDPCDVSEVSEADAEMQRLIDSQVESHKVGSAIAEEVLRSSSSEFSPDLSTDLLQDVVLNEQASLADILCSDISGFNQIRNNVPLSAAGEESPPSMQSAGMMSDLSPPLGSPPLPHLGMDGNGEAAMAVIMTLLEADAGLGGPVNFSGLPWPLP